MQCQSLDQKEIYSFGQIEGIASICTEILSDVLRDSNSSYSLEKYLRSLKDHNSYFNYAISRDMTGHATGVVWQTECMRKSWIRYGDIIFLDAKKKQINSLSWPYIGPCGVDNENRVCLFCESIVLEESHDAYHFVLDSMFSFETSRGEISKNHLWRLLYQENFTEET